MKRLRYTIYMLIGSFALLSCNPGKTIFIKNQTDRPIRLVLRHPEKNPFSTASKSIFELGPEGHEKDTIIQYGKGSRWTESEKTDLTKLFNESVIIFTDRGDTVNTKNIAVQNIGLFVNELYVRIKE